jgi:hypothetical protein
MVYWSPMSELAAETKPVYSTMEVRASSGSVPRLTSAAPTTRVEHSSAAFSTPVTTRERPYQAPWSLHSRSSRRAQPAYRLASCFWVPYARTVWTSVRP